jgi:hypothetical protein
MDASYLHNLRRQLEGNPDPAARATTMTNKIIDPIWETSDGREIPLSVSPC